MRTSSAPLWTRPDFRAIVGSTWRPGGAELTRHGLWLCAFASGAIVLDVGCGAGASLALLREQGCVAVGLDRAVAVNGLAGQSPVIRADATELPFAGASFDGIVMECVLSLVDKPQAVMRQCARILKSGGRVLLTDLFAKNGVGLSAGAVVSRQASCHERALPLAEMENLFAQAGFSIGRFEDHTVKLRELAAKLVWYGQASRESFCACGAGYGLWLLEKGEQA